MATEGFMDRSLQHAFDAEEVMAYLDGELEPQRAAALAGHLEHCAECQEVAKELRVVSGRMMSFEIEPAPANLTVPALPDLNEAAKQEVPKELGYGPRILSKWREQAVKRSVWAFAGALAVVVMVVIVGVSTLNVVRSRQDANFARGRTYDSASPTSRQAGRAAGGYYSAAQKDDADLQRSQAMMSENMVSTPASQRAAEPASPPPQEEKLQSTESVGPMIVQTAALNIVAKNYDEASAAIEKLAKARGGYIEKLDAKAQTGNARELSVALRVPAKQLELFLADLRPLGHVEQESQSNEEVSAQYVDLQARLRVAQATERRLIELLGARTGRLEDVLDAERELARVRSEIESMQGQSAILAHQVSYASVQVELDEEYHEELHSDSAGTRLWNASIKGLRNLKDGVVGVLIFVLNYGLAILFWLAIISVPTWLAWRRFRSRRAAQG